MVAYTASADNYFDWPDYRENLRYDETKRDAAPRCKNDVFIVYVRAPVHVDNNYQAVKSGSSADATVRRADANKRDLQAV